MLIHSQLSRFLMLTMSILRQAAPPGFANDHTMVSPSANRGAVAVQVVSARGARYVPGRTLEKAAQ